jgi:hypothetical protein
MVFRLLAGLGDCGLVINNLFGTGFSSRSPPKGAVERQALFDALSVMA